jgi:hypothetical protein
MNNSPKVFPGRRFEMDWIRVVVTINLIPFHAAWMITSVEGFSLTPKGTAVWNILLAYVRFVSPIHMFLLFLVAGASTFMALGARTPKQYVVERIKRLLIPLLVFMVFLFPVLGYFWPSVFDMRQLNFLTEFWPWCLKTIFYSPITGGPNWGHMWFVGYLFIYSLILLPLFINIRKGRIPFIESWTRFLTGRRGAIYVMAVPLVIAFGVLAPIWPFFRNNLYTDWGYFAYNLSAFYFGFIIARDPGWSAAFDRHAAFSLVLGIVFSAAKVIMEFLLPSFSTPAYNLSYACYSLIAGLNTWCWVIVILGFAGRALSFTNGFLRYFSRISYPFYIFHLVAMPVVGYFIRPMKLWIGAEFVTVCVASFTISMICCEIVKRTRFTSYLFGIKGIRKPIQLGQDQKA